jgi:hypothetical protein
VLRSKAPPTRLSEGRYQLRTFGLQSSALTLVSEEEQPAD